MSSITVIGLHEDRTIEQLERCVAAEEGAVGVLCADGHVGYSQPIGGAVGYRDHISPSGVGYDIGCGNKAVRTDLRVADIEADLARLMDEIVQRISFGLGRRNDEPVDHPVIDAVAAADFAPQRQLRDLAAKQLGTVGAGNHYVDLFADEEGVVWVGVHFGSRGFGHKTASGFLALAQGLPFDGQARDGEMDSPPVLFAVDSDLGQAYIAAMTLAGRYAYAGRDVVVERVLEILGAQSTLEVHNHHNFAWRERHGEDELWVVRKGCTPAFPGQLGFVGASMGEDAVILEGVDAPQAEAALRSTVHGAGRALSRTKAAGRLRKRWVNNVRDDDTAYETEAEALAAPGATKARRTRVRVGGAVDFPAVESELRERGIELRGGAADEAPAAYKRLDEVLTHHADSVVIRHRLRPVGVAMAEADTFDPYKD
ncbi:MAG: RtcB family protein [Solirubrobacteraceae bacterium]|nr:RtcB family protein [Solirubrobacteraceae bacterium]